MKEANENKTSRLTMAVKVITQYYMAWFVVTVMRALIG